MGRIMAIAGGTWQRILRMPVVYFLALCAVVLVGCAYRYDTLSLGLHKVIMVDVSLALNTLAAILVAISITFEIPRELREGVAATLLAKPLGRTRYLVGKFVGVCIAGLVVTGLIGIGFCVVFITAFDKVAVSMMQGHLLVMASVVPMCAVGVFFSVVAPDYLAAVFTALVIWFGHSTSVVLSGVPVLYGGVLPDFNIYNMKAEAAYGLAIDWGYIVLAFIWGVSFSVSIIVVSSSIFSAKDLG